MKIINKSVMKTQVKTGKLFIFHAEPKKMLVYDLWIEITGSSI